MVTVPEWRLCRSLRGQQRFFLLMALIQVGGETYGIIEYAVVSPSTSR